MHITMIVSGGQTGVNQMGLQTAKALGLKTGGWASKGFLTEDGPNLDLGREYGLQELPTVNAPARTKQNVMASDGTVWFGHTSLAGAKHTLRMAKLFHKPLLINPTSDELIAWLGRSCVGVLNVAGPPASKLQPADWDRYEAILTKALRK